MITVDFNCDVGEGMLHEADLFPFISSCNIACGGHFGDAKTIDKSIALAIKNQVKIGAHPSFPDKENFGRKLLNISKEELKGSLKQQLSLFLDRLLKVNQKLHHIKPHGALYNAVAVDKELANIFFESIQDFLGDSCLYVPFQSQIEKVALENNINIKYEAFADRNYTAKGTLVKRIAENAIIHQPEEVLEHVLFMIHHKQVKTIDKTLFSIQADTFCIHGDHKNALPILQYLHKHLITKEIAID
jgi:UPF0271 protein